MDSLELIASEIASCKRCPLHRTRRNPVPGEGSPNADVMFVGEAPGRTEDELGRPFVGAAGKLLTQLLESIGLSREEVFITNIIKCRPPGNRDPTEEEIRACTPFLWRQIAVIKPKIIVALGRHAARVIFERAGLKWVSMKQQHGRVYSASVEGVRVRLIPTYHPAAALYNPQLRAELEKDFKEVIAGEVRRLMELRSERVTLLDFLAQKANV